MRSKLLKIGAAAVASVLLCGGIFMLIHDDVKVQIQEEKLKPYTPDFSVVETIENENPGENNSIRIEENTKETLTENVQQLAEKYDDSVGWLYIPNTQINYPVMFSGDQRDAGPISRFTLLVNSTELREFIFRSSLM